MKSWNILRHSIKQVFGNFEGALRVSAVLYAAQFAATALLGSAMPQDQAGMTQAMHDGTVPMWPILIGTLVSIVLCIWIVVGWHRYILLNEGAKLVPTFEQGRIFAYFGRSIQIGILTVLAAFVVVFVFGVLVAAPMSAPNNSLILGTIFSIAVLFPILIVMYRLSVLLPAAAIGRQMAFSQAWDAMKGETGMLAMLALVTTVLSVAMGLPMYYLEQLGTIPSLAYQFVVGWIHLMVGASIVTTLYGIYVEGRALAYS